ncbi:MAG: ATP-binding cassette domain-containing protein [Oscillospiraceae bacterium]|nr:ATP-binding cassette domain-containing protein [Oscillospiraceae bacterium]
MLELQHLSFRVEDEGRPKGILRDVSLSIPDRELVVVTGPNGGGKSTLARLIAGVGDIRTGSCPHGQCPCLPAARPLQGSAGPGSAPDRRGQAAWRGRGLRISLRRGPLREGLYRTGGKRLSVRRRAQAHRDRHGPGPGREALHL